MSMMSGWTDTAVNGWYGSTEYGLIVLMCDVCLRAAVIGNVVGLSLLQVAD